MRLRSSAFSFLLPVFFSVTSCGGSGEAPGDADPDPSSPSLEEGMAAYWDRDYATAQSIFQSLADRGDPEAQFSLGNLYTYGQGVERDLAEGTRWYRLSAEQGHANGQFALGWMYLNWDGLELDTDEAQRLYRAAAEQGHREAQYELGRHLLMGAVFPRDFDAGFRWLGMAARQGRAEAQRELAYAYRTGSGTPTDLVRAHMWYTIAASGLAGDIAEAAGRRRTDVAREMTREQVARAEALTERCRQSGLQDC